MKENLIGQANTKITNNDDNTRSTYDDDLQKKEVKRLKKFHKYEFCRIHKILESPLLPTLMKTTNMSTQSTKFSIPSYFKKISKKSTKFESSPLDAIQGNISNCYLISSLSSLGAYTDLVERLVLAFDPIIGLYSVSLCIDGKFTEILLDDLFPSSLSRLDLNSVTGNKIRKLRLCHPNLKNIDHKIGKHKAKILEIPIWAILIEKAYSKIFGAYWNIGGGGGSVRALKDITCAPVSFHFFDEGTQAEIWKMLTKSVKEGLPMAAPTHQKTSRLNNLKFLLSNWHSTQYWALSRRSMIKG